MSLTIELSSHEEKSLRQEAARQGLPPEELILQAVKKLLPPADIQAKLDALRTLLDDDEDEQRETGEYLMRALDEDRPSYRKLFPWRE